MMVKKEKKKKKKGRILTLLRVQLPNIPRRQLLLRQLRLLLDPLLVSVRQTDELLQSVFVPVSIGPEVIHLERFRPDVLV